MMPNIFFKNYMMCITYIKIVPILYYKVCVYCNNSQVIRMNHIAKILSHSNFNMSVIET